MTRKQYAAFVAETGHRGSGCAVLPLDGTSGGKFDPALSWRDPGFAQADNHPVVCVSWDDGIAYASWLSKKTGRHYRLPSEAEWEYAARAGDTAGRYFGDAPICEFANVRDQSKKKLRSTGQFLECNSGFSNTSPVASFPPNGFGLYDMLGNVWEWVEDCWGSYGDAPGDGAAHENAVCKEGVRRGGSWNSLERYLYNAGTRGRGLPDARWDWYGFRVASDYPAAASAPSESPTIAQSAHSATSSPAAPQSSDWDGTWVGSWGGQAAAKIIISEGNVVEYDYRGNRQHQQGLGQTIISGDTLTFGTPAGSVITLTRRGPTIAGAHYNGPPGEADAELVRSSPGALQSSEWDGTWIGSWDSDIAAKIVISEGKVLECDYRGFPEKDLGQTNVSGNILTFGTPPGFVITLTKRGPTIAAAHYHGSSGEVDGELVRQ